MAIPKSSKAFVHLYIRLRERVRLFKGASRLGESAGVSPTASWPIAMASCRPSTAPICL